MRLLKSAGSFLNDLTGATSAGSQSQKYALQSGAINNAYQKEFAQNAHQWEIEDLKKAGLNPILSSGGSGASASGGGVNSANVTSAGYTPLDIFQTGINAYTGIQNAKKVKAETDNTNANTEFTRLKGLLETKRLAIETKMSDAQIKKIDMEIMESTERILRTQGGWLSETFGTQIQHMPKDTIEWLMDKLTKIPLESKKELTQKLMDFRIKNKRPPTKKEIAEMIDDPFQPKNKKE